jgi:hypothetical protein
MTADLVYFLEIVLLFKQHKITQAEKKIAY